MVRDTGLSIFIHYYKIKNSKTKLLNTKNKNKPELEVLALDNWEEETRRSETKRFMELGQFKLTNQNKL